MNRFLAIALLFGATDAYGANLLTNGSFETPIVSSFQVIGTAGEPAGFGWDVFAGDVDVDRSNLLGTSLLAQDGEQWLDLNGFEQGFIQQFFPTAPGVNYRVSFYYADNPFSNGSGSQQGVLKSGNMTIRNAADSALLASQAFVHSTTTGANADWIYSGDIFFTAASALTRIAFSGDGDSGSTGPFIDNVTVQIPEPGSLGLVLVALGVAAVILRRPSRVRPLPLQ